MAAKPRQTYMSLRPHGATIIQTGRIFKKESDTLPGLVPVMLSAVPRQKQERVISDYQRPPPCANA
jgi:hypothetical protein